MIEQVPLTAIIGVSDITAWAAVAFAFAAGLLTLYSAIKLQGGVLAVSMALSGTGMLALAIGFLFNATPQWADTEVISSVHSLLFILGFVLLSFGAFKIYRMSRIGR